MVERVVVTDITNEEGNKFLQIVRRGLGLGGRWRRAQIVLRSAQRMDLPAIAKIAFTSQDRVREVIHNFTRHSFDSLTPKYAEGWAPKFSAAERVAIKEIALGRPTDYGGYFCLDGTDHESHEAEAFLIRHYIAWRNRQAQDQALRELVKLAKVAGHGISGRGSGPPPGHPPARPIVS